MEPFVGEIRIFAGLHIPDGWAACDGSLIDINDNQTLFSLIGSIYGGDGVTNFALPDLRGRVPVGVGTGPGLSPRSLGEKGGSEMVTLAQTQLPQHTHFLSASTNQGTTPTPGSTVGYAVTASNIHPYVDLTKPTNPSANYAANALAPAGGNAPHNNMMPTSSIKFMIATDGIYPS